MKKQIKTSIGLGICRRDPVSGVPQILLVQSRMTYCFTNFAFGKYKIWDTDRLQHLVDGMTQEEKILVWAGNFEKIWFHIWFRIPQLNDTTDNFLNFYINSKSKFDQLFLKDNGKKLRILLSKSATRGSLGWDIPKGRKLESEHELDCCQRELREETELTPDTYTVMFDVRPIVYSYEDETSIYINKYYAAWTTRSIEPRLNYFNNDQLCEIRDIKWFGMTEIYKLGHQNHQLPAHCKLLLKLYKRRIKKKIKITPEAASL